MKKWKKILMVFLMTLLFAGTLTVSSQAAAKLSATKIYLIKGQKKTLKVRGTTKKVKWVTRHKSIATVSSKGVVTAKKVGTTVVAAKVGGKKLRCTVVVQNPKISNTSLQLKVKGRARLKMLNCSQNVTWTSSDTSVASVSKDSINSCYVTGKKAGRAVITGTVGGKNFTCTLTVIDYITVSSGSVTLNIGATTEIDVDTSLSTLWAKSMNQNIVEASMKDPPNSGHSATVILRAKSSGTTTIQINNSQTNPTLTKSIQVTVTSQSADPSSGRQRLKEYILAHGKVNTNGNRFLRAEQTTASASFVYGVVYDPVRHVFQFIMTSNYDTGANGTVEMLVPESSSGLLTVKYVVVLSSNRYSATTTLNPTTYTGNTNVQFRMANANNYPVELVESVVNLANAELKIAFKGWANSILKAQANIPIYEIGFYAYR